MKRRVAGRVRDDRARRPIEAVQNRMFCEAGLVKTRLAARAVPDQDPGPLAREHRPQQSAVSPRHHDFVKTICFGKAASRWY
ncbi:MAG: hypothetical protein WBN06_04385, partial [Lysobacterales bacterium]